MARKNLRLGRSLLVAACVVCALFLTAQPARAQGIIYGSSIPAGEVVEKNVILYGDEVTIDGSVDGDVFAIGRNVTVNGGVQGNLFAAGEAVIINGQVDGNVYAASATMELGESAEVGRDLIYAGFSLITQPGSVVGRDLNTLTLGGQFYGQVGRDMKAIIGPLEFIRLFTENVDLSQLRLPEGSSTGTGVVVQEIEFPLVGTLLTVVTNEQASQTVGGSRLGATAPTSTAQTGGIDTERLSEWAMAWLRELTILLLIGLLGVWLLPSHLAGTAEQAREKPLAAIGYGLLAAINGFLFTVLAFGVFLLLGLWLGSIGLWDMAFLFWGIFISALGLAFAIFILLLCYGSKIIISYLVGVLILKRLAPKVVEYRVLPLLLGLVIYVLLHSIPVLGWLVSLVVTSMGLGAVWLVYRKRRLARDKAPEPVDPAVEAA